MTTVYSAAQIASIARQAGFPESAIPTAVAIALAESSGKPLDHNTNALTGDDSYGLWQINMISPYGPSRRKAFGISSNSQLFDPVTNAKAAMVLSNGGKNWKPWSTYPVKSALFMPTATKAAGVKGTASQAFDWNDPFGLWPKGEGNAPGSLGGDSLNDWTDSGGSKSESLGGSGLWSMGTLLTGLSKAITNPDNWRNWAYVALGGALVISGLVIVTKPYAQQVANASPTGRAVKVAKYATGKG